MSETVPIPIIETRDLTRIYGDGQSIRALDGVNMIVQPGEFLAVMGPSGSGKSTLLHILGALDRPTSGTVMINGQDLAQTRDLDRFRARSVGFIFQLHNLLPTMTALENVETPMNGILPARKQRKRARELLELVGLGDRMNHLPNQLSGGQRQRAAAARALANDPPLILADEPTGSLDTVSGQELMRLLGDLNQQRGVTIVVVTHDISIARLTRRVVVMQDGRIVREDIIGSPMEEDIKVLQHSILGRAVAEGAPGLGDSLGLSLAQLEALQSLITGH